MKEQNLENSQKLFFDKKGISDYFGWSVRTTDQLRADRGLPCRVTGHVIRFYLPEVLEWYENFRVGGTVGGEVGG